MPQHVRDQFIDLHPLMIARAFVMHIPERALNGIRLRTVRRQVDYLKVLMRCEPFNHRFRSVYPIVVHHDVDARELNCPTPFVNQLQQVDEEPPVLALCCDGEHLARDIVKRARQIVLPVRAWRHDFGLRALGHPLIADLGEQVDVQFVGEKQGFCRQQPLDQRTNASEFHDSLLIIVTRHMARPLPRVAKFMKPALDGLAGNARATSRFEFKGQSGTTPSSSTPPEGRWRTPHNRAQGAFERRPVWLRCACGWRTVEPSLATLIGVNNSVDAGARAEQAGSNLGRRSPLRAQQQNVEREQVAVASGAQFLEQRGLFVGRYVKYRFPRHRQFTNDKGLGSTYRFIRKNLSVPIS